MVKVTVDLDTSKISKISDKMPEVRKKGMSYTAQSMVNRLMDNSPVDHGLLKSWFIDSFSGDEVHIKSPAEYAIYQDQGTSPHSIFPVNKKALYWKGADHPIPASVGVYHPGIKAKHFVEKSFNEVSPQLEGFFIRALHEVLE